MIANCVVKNKFWVVENRGEKIATIQATNAGFVYVHNNERERFPSIKGISKKYNLTFGTAKTRTYKDDAHTCHGFPTSCKPHNQLWDVKLKIPLFAQTSKSKCLYGAGYYAIKHTAETGFMTEYCPKYITLARNQYIGPFKSNIELTEYLTERNECH